MGFDGSATHVRAPQSAIVALLRPIIRSRAVVTPARNGWTSVYDESSVRSLAEGSRVSGALSKRLATVGIYTSVFDSDILRYALFDHGRKVDEFHSAPNYFAPASESTIRRTAGRPSILKSYCRAHVSDTAIRKLLTRDDPDWEGDEEERLLLLANVLRIDPDRATDYFAQAIETRGQGYVTILGHLPHENR